MIYATQQNMVDRFGADELLKLTDRTNTGAIDANVVGRALADASDEIDGYVSGVVSLPLASVPDRLVKLTCDIARYDLYGVHCTDAIRLRYTDAIDFLKRVVSGTASLGLDSGAGLLSEPGDVGMNPVAPVFSHAGLSDY